MKKCIAVLLLLGSTPLIFAQSYKKLHVKAVVVDTHNDILTTAINKGFSFDADLKGKTHSDLARWAAGGLDVQVFSIWCDGTFGKGKAFARANQQIDTLYAVVNRNAGKMMIVTSPADLQKAVKQHKLGAMMGVEGGHMIEDRLDYLDSLYRRGVRYMTLTWNNSTDWATSAMYETRGNRRDSTASPQPSRSTGTGSPVEGEQDTPRQKGLTDFGKQVVRRMNELGMLVDLSHVGEQTFWDAINLSTKPVIASHSCAWAICPVFRNLKDDQIKAIAKNGGVIHINFFSGFVDSSFTRRNRAFNQKHRAERDSLLKTVTDAYFADDYLFEKYHEEAKDLRPPLSMLLDHIDYMVKLAGIDHVGLGSDFDGISSTPQQLDDVTTYPIITQELLKRGYSKKDIRKILGENFIRVFKANSK